MKHTKRARSRPTEPPTEELSSAERLHKVLAHAGVGSRRHCEELIRAGRVTVDDRVVRELGTKVDPAAQRIAVDGKPARIERLVYFAVNKPKNVLSTNDDPEGRPRVIDLLPEIPQRVYTVGRLDDQSEGLMLVTNDGELANRLTHPRYGVWKTYVVQVAGRPTADELERLTKGVYLSEGQVRARHVKPIGKRGESTLLELVLTEGHNREIRRMLARLGHKVLHLTRTRIGNLRLRGLKSGRARRLTGEELDGLRRLVSRSSAEPAQDRAAAGRRRPAAESSGPRPRSRASRPAGRAAPRSGPRARRTS